MCVVSGCVLTLFVFRSRVSSRRGTALELMYQSMASEERLLGEPYNTLNTCGIAYNDDDKDCVARFHRGISTNRCSGFRGRQCREQRVRKVHQRDVSSATRMTTFCNIGALPGFGDIYLGYELPLQNVEQYILGSSSISHQITPRKQDSGSRQPVFFGVMYWCCLAFVGYIVFVTI